MWAQPLGGALSTMRTLLLLLLLKWLQSCLTLCNPTDSSPPGSPVHGILQARILEWVAGAGKYHSGVLSLISPGGSPSQQQVGTSPETPQVKQSAVQGPSAAHQGTDGI